MEPLSDLSLADLLTFQAVERTRSISSAARALEVTPSQVSKAVRRLEKQLSCTLLVRTARGITLSDDGRRAASEIQLVVGRLRALRNRNESVDRELTIAGATYLNSAFSPTVAATFPKLRLRVLDLVPAMIRTFATEHLFDVVISVGDPLLPAAWSVKQVGELRKALFASPRLIARAGLKGSVDVEQLRPLPFVSPVGQRNGVLVPLEDDCPLGYAARFMGTSTETFGMALDIAAQADQLVFGPAVSAQRHLASGELVEVTVEGWDVRHPLYLACESDRVTASFQRGLIRVIQQVLANDR